jgi:protoheme IX farnesyltransferase
MQPSSTTSRWTDYLAITRPRISVLVLFTVGAGGLYAGLPTTAPWLLILNAVLGTALVASGASAINQWLERDTDALMLRTRKRPLPAGRVSLAEAFVFGLILALVGAVYLLATMPTPLPALLAAFTFASYIAVYTPLKRVTTLNTVIGAVPGAMPPLIGYAAVRGEISSEAWALFAILFVWQIPHFLAIAWMYREDYGRAGLRMLPVVDPQGTVTARQMVLYCIALLPTGLMPVMVGGAGWFYGIGSTLLAIYFLRSAIAFARQREDALAKKAMRASLVYLPLVLMLLVIDRWMH